MAANFAGSAQVFLDTCCVLNLYATGRMEEILSMLPERFVVADAGLRESLYVRDLPSQKEQQAVDLTEIIDSGLLAAARGRRSRGSASRLFLQLLLLPSLSASRRPHRPRIA